MIVLVTGGSGCGKSYFSERLLIKLSEGAPKYYIATMDAYDDESKRRVARHRAQRAGLGFQTIERPLDIGGIALPPGSTAMLECAATLLSNEMFLPGGDADSIIRGVHHLSKMAAHLVIVTNDVFSDGVSYPDMTDEYLRKLAHINRAAAEMADTVVEVVYSIPVKIKGDLP